MTTWRERREVNGKKVGGKKDVSRNKQGNEVFAEKKSRKKADKRRVAESSRSRGGEDKNRCVRGNDGG